MQLLPHYHQNHFTFNFLIFYDKSTNMNINFQLESPMPFLNVEATKGSFFLQYPSGWSYWNITTEGGQILKEGNYTFPQAVLDTWLESDDVLIANILEAKPWDIVVSEPIF